MLVSQVFLRLVNDHLEVFFSSHDLCFYLCDILNDCLHVNFHLLHVSEMFPLMPFVHILCVFHVLVRLVKHCIYLA